MINDPQFPRLTANNHHKTSDPSFEYNCIAWAAGDTKNWWQPGVYWPVKLPADEFGMGALEQAFLSLGYASGALDDNLEPGFEKVALYGFGFMYTHAARQLPSGKWTSKIGEDIDIEHDTPNDVAGGLYGDVMEIMKRPVAQSFTIKFVVPPDHLIKQADEILRASIRCTKELRREIRAVAKAYIDEADELKRSVNEIQTKARKVQIQSGAPVEMVLRARRLESVALANKEMQEKVRGGEELCPGRRRERSFVQGVPREAP